jgi:ribonuclease BN (tRNA processing enzyme)
VRITVLGKSPSWQDADGACSGYLVEERETCVLLDCGNGVFSKLRCFRDYAAVDAVVISHMHADHFLDLVPFAYALTYAPRQQPATGSHAPARPALHAPRGARDLFRRVVGAWGSEDLIEKAFDLQEYGAGDGLAIGSLKLRFSRVPHFVPTHAVEFSSVLDGAARFTFGADSGPSDDLVRFADGADLLMLEATLPTPESDGERGHLTPAEAGEHATRARARRLVLTHISDELDELWAKAEAEKFFRGPVTVAREGAVYEVPVQASRLPV